MLVQRVTLIARKMCLRKWYHLFNNWTILQSFKEVLLKILFCGLQMRSSELQVAFLLQITWVHKPRLILKEEMGLIQLEWTLICKNISISINMCIWEIEMYVNIRYQKKKNHFFRKIYFKLRREQHLQKCWNTALGISLSCSTWVTLIFHGNMRLQVSHNCFAPCF